MSDEPAKKKDELLRLLCDVESEATRVEALGQDIVRAARFTVDVVRPIRYVISQVPPEALPKDAAELETQENLRPKDQHPDFVEGGSDKFDELHRTTAPMRVCWVNTPGAKNSPRCAATPT